MTVQIRIENLDPTVDKVAVINAVMPIATVKRCAKPVPGVLIMTLENEAAAQKAIAAFNGKTFGASKISVKKDEGDAGSPSPAAHGAAPPSQKKPSGDIFINPYAFLPVSRMKDDPFCLREFLAEGPHFQDRFREGTLSGRVVCEMATESPLFIGAGKMEDYNEKANPVTAGKLQPFELNNQAAIPPASIKGMLSSLMEAASNSAMRVLEKSIYTRRMEPRGEPLSNIGILRKKDTRWYIEKLTKDYIYLNRYSFDKAKGQFTAQGTLANASLRDYSVDPVWHYARRAEVQPPNRKHSHRFLTPGNGSFISQEQFARLAPAQQRNYEKGIVKHLGVVGANRDKEMPHTKKHEIFIPYPDAGVLLEVLPEAITHFDQLAAEAFGRDEGFPFTPIGRHPSPKRPVQLREGDLLYYRTRTQGNSVVVDKLSFSSIWRDFCGPDPAQSNAYQFFKTIDPNGFLLPPCLNNQNKQKAMELRLTPVCSLLGFVEEEKGKSQKQALAMAGRVFFSPGVLSPGQAPETVRLPERTLKELASPKPPCPEFYFHKKGATRANAFIGKKDLRPDGSHLPKGRKSYWHHQNPNDPWAPDQAYIAGHYKRIWRVEPIREQTRFLFSLDFFNLTPVDLGMLLYALRPSNEFRHQIGMGKPIGMGRVKIDTLNLLLVNRKERYEKDPLFAPGFFHSQSLNKSQRLEEVKNAFAQDARGQFNRARFCAHGSVAHEHDIGYYVSQFTKEIKRLYGDDWLNPLENMGNPESIDQKGVPVQYPNLERGGFEESFKWWVTNRAGSQEMLPLVPRGEKGKAATLPLNPR